MKAIFITFVRGLKNGTPPRFQSYLKSLTLLLVMMLSVNVWGEEISFIFTGTEKNCSATSGKVGNIEYESGKTGNASDCIYNTTNGLVLYYNNGDYGYFGNKTEMPSGITKILVKSNVKKNSPKYKVYGSKDKSNWTQIGSETTGGNEFSQTSTDGYLYVQIRSSASGQLGINSVIITYTAAAANPCTVTFDAGSNGTLSCPSCTEGNKLTEESAGAGVTLPSVIANDGWKFLGWATTSGATTADAGEAGATYKPSKDITLYAVYIQQFDVKWYVNGELKKTDTYDKGANLALPQGVSPTSSDCDNYKVFVGWRENTLDQPTDTKPSGIFTTASGTVTASATYHAVFALKEGEDDEYIRVTQLSELKDGISVVLVSNKYSTALTHTATPSLSYTTAPTESSSKITATDAMKWTLVKSDTKWLIKYGDKSIGASTLPSSGSSNKSKSISFTNTYSTWTIAASSYGTNNFYFSNGTTSALEASSSTANWVVYYSTAANMPGSEYYATKVYKSTVSYSQYSTSCVAAAVETPTITTTAEKVQELYWDQIPISMACETEGAKIYYTTDGSVPSASSTEYTGQINISATTTIRAIAIKGGDSSYENNATFTFGKVYADVAAWLADVVTIEDGDKVKINNVNVIITNISSNRTTVYFDGASFYTGSEVSGWYAGGTLKASNIIFTSKVFSGPSYQLRPSAWSDLTYVTLSSIAVTDFPKTDYTDGDKFDPTGLVITKTYSDNTTEEFTYADNASAFTFNPTLTTALRPSNTKISITVNGKSCDLTITVASIPVTGVTLNNTSAALFKGQTLQLNATVAPSNATTQTVSWSTDDATIASVSNIGLVKAEGAGHATITVTTTDQSKTATCDVNAYSVTINKVGDEGKSGNTATFNPSNCQVTIGTAEHFTFQGIEVTGATCTGSASPYTLSNPTANVDVKATWKEDPKVTVTWHIGAGSQETAGVYVGTTYSLLLPPSVADDAAGDCATKFMGWATAAINGSTGVEKEEVAWVTDEYVIDDTHKDIYAVFATKEGTGGDFTLVSGVSHLGEGEAYIGSYISYSGSNYYVATSASDIATTTLSNNVLTPTAAMLKLTLVSTGTANQYYLKDANGKYLHASSTGVNPTLSETACAWTFSGESSLMGMKSSLGSNVYLCAYSSNGTTGKLKTYSSASGNTKICVYLSSATYSNYITQCCTTHEVKKGTMTRGGFTATPAQACADAEVTLVPDEVIGYNFKNFTFATEGGESINPDDIYFMDNEFLMPDYNIVVTANYEVASYSIEYNLNGGEWDGAEGVSSYTYGVGAILPTNVKKEGNNFDGWYLNNEGERITSIAANETGNKSFTARWIPLTTRTITYIGADSHITFAEKPATIDGTATDLTINYTLDNHYKLDGVKVAIGGVELTGEDEVIYDDTELRIMPDAGKFADNITITFDIKPIEFTVQWLVNGTLVKEIEHVLEGTTYGTLTAPEDPANNALESCDANKFMGWAVMDWEGTQTKADFEAVQVTDGYEIKENQTTFYAVFATEGEGAVKVGDVLWAEDFSGFSANDVPSESNENTVVYGDASLAYSTVSAGGGTSKIYNENNAGGTAPELLIGKQGASFGCSNVPTGGATKMNFSFNTNQTSNITVTSSTDGITIGTLSISDKVASCEIDNPNKLSTFQIQINRTTSSNSREDNISLTVAEAPVSYTNYITNCDMSTYRVMFDANAPEGEIVTGSVPTTAEVNPAEDYTIPAANLTAEHYTQIGWNESKTATTAQTKVEKMDAGLSTTLYAVWQAKKYTIMYVDGGEESSTVEVAYGQSTTAPAMKTSCPDYQQIGWTDVDPSENKWATKPNIVVEPNADFVVTDDAILYAVYAEVSGDPTKFELISGISELESGANYIITGLGEDAEYALNNTFTENSYNNMGATEVEVDDEDIITTTNAAIIWKVTAVADGYTIYNAKANKYLSGDGTDIDFVETNPVAFTLADMNGSAISIYSTALGYYKYLTYYNHDFETYDEDANYFYKQKFVATYLANPVCKEVNSISVKHAPTKVDYVEGESFNPSGLVITINYTEGDPEDVAYDDAAIKFSFTPALSEALKQSDKQVTITYGGKICKQTITVAEYVVPTYYLIGNEESLEEGDVIVLGCANYDENGTSAVAGEFTDKYFSVQEAEISKGILKSENAIEFVLGKDGNNWTLSTEGKLVGASKAKELLLGSGTTTWTISFDEKGNALITSSSGYGTIKFNTDYSHYPRFINYASGGMNIQIYSKRDTRYKRTDLVVGNYGTLCVPYAVKATDRSGATFWNIETSNAPGSAAPTSITIVEETGDLEAGKPYIFCATETEMAMFFSGEEYKLEDHEDATVPANGLYGNLTDANIIINETEYIPGYFFVLQQKLYECGVNCTVGPNRGWVQAAEIEDKTTPSPAPRRVIGNPNGTPTGINNLNTDGLMNIQGARKYFHNNNIVIVNEGRIYNAQGILIQ